MASLKECQLFRDGGIEGELQLLWLAYQCLKQKEEFPERVGSGFKEGRGISGAGCQEEGRCR